MTRAMIERKLSNGWSSNNSSSTMGIPMVDITLEAGGEDNQGEGRDESRLEESGRDAERGQGICVPL